MSEHASGPVRLITVNWCPWCQKALHLLGDRAVPHENIDLTSDSEQLKEMKARYSWPTVPIVLVGETVVGGFSELAKLDQETALEHLKEA